MGSRGRGGYQPPASPAAASPPGALSQRTDGGPGQKITPTPTNRPGGQQGDRQASIQQQQAAPLRLGGVAAPEVAAGPGGGPGGGMPMAEAPPVPDAFGPTNRPNEPVTAGARLGAGPGPNQGVTISDQVRALYQQYPYDGIRAILEELDAGQGAL